MLKGTWCVACLHQRCILLFGKGGPRCRLQKLPVFHAQRRLCGLRQLRSRQPLLPPHSPQLPSPHIRQLLLRLFQRSKLELIDRVHFQEEEAWWKAFYPQHWKSLTRKLPLFLRSTPNTAYWKTHLWQEAQGSSENLLCDHRPHWELLSGLTVVKGSPSPQVWIQVSQPTL